MEKGKGKEDDTMKNYIMNHHKNIEEQKMPNPYV